MKLKGEKRKRQVSRSRRLQRRPGTRRPVTLPKKFAGNWVFPGRSFVQQKREKGKDVVVTH